LRNIWLKQSQWLCAHGHNAKKWNRNVQGSDGGNRQEIEREAARLLVRLQSEPDSEEQSRIWAWIEADPAHAVAFARAEAAWDQAERLKASTYTIDLDSEASAANLNDISFVPASRWSKAQRSFMIGGAVAASLLLVGAGVNAKMSGDASGLAATSGSRCNGAKK
jgi:transmembrane sensor